MMPNFIGFLITIEPELASLGFVLIFFRELNILFYLKRESAY